MNLIWRIHRHFRGINRAFNSPFANAGFLVDYLAMALMIRTLSRPVVVGVTTADDGAGDVDCGFPLLLSTLDVLFNHAILLQLPH